MAEQGKEADRNERASERRKSVIDRRAGVERRGARPAGKATNLERRRGPGRRRTDFMRAAEEGEMTQEQFMFVMAIDSFKRVNGLTFPTWTEVLEVIRKLGYRKTMASELNSINDSKRLFWCFKSSPARFLSEISFSNTCTLFSNSS